MSSCFALMKEIFHSLKLAVTFAQFLKENLTVAAKIFKPPNKNNIKGTLVVQRK